MTESGIVILEKIKSCIASNRRVEDLLIEQLTEAINEINSLYQTYNVPEDFSNSKTIHRRGVGKDH